MSLVSEHKEIIMLFIKKIKTNWLLENFKSILKGWKIREREKLHIERMQNKRVKILYLYNVVGGKN
jgi:hypothetical protein